MSITDELREYSKTTAASPAVFKELTDIADRIDEKHAKLRDKAYNDGVCDGIDADKNAMGYIRGPVDADGVPWHLGDKVDGMVGEITYLSLGYIGWTFSFGGLYTFQCEKYRHYHESTVEDVLREIVHKCQPTYSKDGSYTTGLTKEEFAEYAAKLRLAGEAE